MSAAEALRALPADTIGACALLRVPLPLIADVVEAGERAESLLEDIFQQEGLWSEREFAHEALIRTLTALREYLEGGTVRDSKLSKRFDWNSRDGIT